MPFLLARSTSIVWNAFISKKWNVSPQRKRLLLRGRRWVNGRMRARAKKPIHMSGCSPRFIYNIKGKNVISDKNELRIFISIRWLYVHGVALMGRKVLFKHSKIQMDNFHLSRRQQWMHKIFHQSNLHCIRAVIRKSQRKLYFGKWKNGFSCVAMPLCSHKRRHIINYTMKNVPV